MSDVDKNTEVKN